MTRRRGFDPKGTPIRVPRTAKRTILAVTIVAVGLGLAGCGEEMARIDENQLRLQATAEDNAQQIAALAAHIERSQQSTERLTAELQAAFESVQNDVREVAANVAIVAAEQSKLHKASENNGQQVASEMTEVVQSVALLQESQGLLAENQQSTGRLTAELKAGIDSARQQSLAVAADVSAISEQQANLYQAVESLGLLTENTQEMAVAVSSLGEDMLRLQEMLRAESSGLQDNIRELVETTNQQQLEFQPKIQDDLVALDASVTAVKQSLGLLTESQSKMQGRIEEVRNAAQAITSDVPEAIAQLRDEMEELSRNAAQAQLGREESEPPPESSAPDETNGVE